jgi:hypothetical protein
MHVVKRLRLGLVAGVAVLGLAVAFIIGPRLHGPVTPETLTLSVERVIAGREGTGQPEGCVQQRVARWRCAVYGPASRTTIYEVRVHDGSCWTANLLDSGGQSTPGRPGGCVLRGDHSDEAEERPGGPRTFPES